MSTNTATEPWWRGLLRLLELGLGAVAGFVFAAFYAAYMPDINILDWIVTPDGQIRFIGVLLTTLAFVAGIKLPDTRSHWVEAICWFLVMAGMMTFISSFFTEALIATSIGRQ